MRSPTVLTICKHTAIFLAVLLSCTMTESQEETQESEREAPKLCYKCFINGEEGCIHWDLRCDGTPDCDRGQDELFETCYGDTCVNTLVAVRRCDGVKDCTDGRDEYYDGCDHGGVNTSTYTFGNLSVAVAVVFLIGVIVALTSLLFCICCCCRKGRENRPYISKPAPNSRKCTLSNSANGYRWASHTLPSTYSFTMDGNALYNASDDSVEIRVS